MIIPPIQNYYDPSVVSPIDYPDPSSLFDPNASLSEAQVQAYKNASNSRVLQQALFNTKSMLNPSENIFATNNSLQLNPFIGLDQSQSQSHLYGFGQSNGMQSLVQHYLNSFIQQQQQQNTLTPQPSSDIIDPEVIDDVRSDRSMYKMYFKQIRKLLKILFSKVNMFNILFLFLDHLRYLKELITSAKNSFDRIGYGRNKIELPTLSNIDDSIARSQRKPIFPGY